MSSNDSLPTCAEPCTRKTSELIGSVWLTPSEFGECYFRPSDSELYPCLIPVFNGEVLKIKSELIHASLSAISVKHHYGKCYQEVEQEGTESNDTHSQSGEQNDYDVSDLNEELSLQSLKPRLRPLGKAGAGEASSAEEIKGKFENTALMLPNCMRQNINYRNSFWNLHRPELCKLTWSQKYVSSATITEHLHSHLIYHGPLCADCHEKKDRVSMLNKELDEYGRLKVLASPRNLPPDEAQFDFRVDVPHPSKLYSENIKCKGLIRKPVTHAEPRFWQFSDDEEVVSEGKGIRRSKEEFCLTIGRHVRRQPITKSLSDLEEATGESDVFSHPDKEEEGEFLFFDWHQVNAEESYEGETDESTIDIEPFPTTLSQPCPVLGMDDFCRAVAKADFSDLRCNPDDF